LIRPCAAADGPRTLRLPPEKRCDLLALLADERPMQALLRSLREGGFHIDVACDLGSARQVFFAAGGHDCIVIGPDVAPGIADAVVGSLREVDPELPAVTYGRELGKTKQARTATLHLHPGSRAGAGALLRFLHELPEKR
jgi:hypothetical protein